MGASLCQSSHDILFHWPSQVLVLVTCYKQVYYAYPLPWPLTSPYLAESTFQIRTLTALCLWVQVRESVLTNCGRSKNSVTHRSAKQQMVPMELPRRYSRGGAQGCMWGFCMGCTPLYMVGLGPCMVCLWVRVSSPSQPALKPLSITPWAPQKTDSV